MQRIEKVKREPIGFPGIPETLKGGMDYKKQKGKLSENMKKEKFLQYNEVELVGHDRTLLLRLFTGAARQENRNVRKREMVMEG